MKTIKIFLLLSITCCFTIKYSEASEIVPGKSSDGIESLETYQAPYQKFGEIGFFAEDKRLKYSIAEDQLDEEQYNSFKDLILLSDNHWIALNKRDLSLATKISSKMQGILLGNHGLNEVIVSQAQKKKLMELKLRCVEQIEMSTPRINLPSIISTDKLLCRNDAECRGIHALARSLTNTPLFFQDVSYDFSKKYGISENAYVIEPILDMIHLASEEILKDCIKEHPDQGLAIQELYTIKKECYVDYLKHIYEKLHTIKMTDYRAVDRGQTSGSHRNACMFNSVFYLDLMKRNIPSTKLGSIESGRNYLSHISHLYAPYSGLLDKNPLFESTQISQTLNVLVTNTAAEASYSFVSTIQYGQIFPGILSNCSALEIQSHSLMSNFAIFPKVKIHDQGNCLFSNYGAGYYGSENFPIIPVSCSTGHAQALVLL